MPTWTICDSKAANVRLETSITNVPFENEENCSTVHLIMICISLQLVIGYGRLPCSNAMREKDWRRCFSSFDSFTPAKVIEAMTAGSWFQCRKNCSCKQWLNRQWTSSWACIERIKWSLIEMKWFQIDYFVALWIILLLYGTKKIKWWFLFRCFC